MGIVDRGRHVIRRFQRGIAEHDALVACAVLVHALGDMGGLAVQVVVNLQGFPVELLLLIADVAHAIAHDAVDAGHHRLGLGLVGQADLATNHHAVRRGEGFAGHAGQGFLGQEGIQHRVRNAVAQLVGMPLRNGFGGEDIVRSAHGKVLHWGNPPRQEAVVTGLLACLDLAPRRVKQMRADGRARKAGRDPPATAGPGRRRTGRKASGARPR
jgi:hypothetical protein